MNKASLVLLSSLFLNGCATIGVSTAEITGVSLFQDRRTTESIFLDEKIENNASITLSLDSEIRQNSHFNITSYNGIVLITGETLDSNVLARITATVQKLNDVRIVKNQMQLAPISSFTSRTNDSLMTAKIKSAIAQDSRLSGLDATRIKVITEHHRVFLMGLVYQQEGEIATDIARQQPGVEEVIKVFEYL
jgi:osmotically-inducible protein OsmY